MRLLENLMFKKATSKIQNAVVFTAVVVVCANKTKCRPQETVIHKTSPSKKQQVLQHNSFSL